MVFERCQAELAHRRAEGRPQDGDEDGPYRQAQQHLAKANQTSSRLGSTWTGSANLVLEKFEGCCPVVVGDRECVPAPGAKVEVRRCPPSVVPNDVRFDAMRGQHPSSHLSVRA